MNLWLKTRPVPNRDLRENLPTIKTRDYLVCLSFNYAYEPKITRFAKYNYQLINVGVLSKQLVDFFLNGNYKLPVGDAQVNPSYLGSCTSMEW